MSVSIVACSGGGDGDDDHDGNEDQAVDCGFPTPRVAGTLTTDTLANAPARCGMPEYAWLRAPDLGEIVARHQLFDYTTIELEQIAAAEGLSIQPVYATAVERITYKTQDRGALIDATAMIAYPTNLADDVPVDTLLYLHGTAGMSDICAPSVSDNALALAGLFASQGYLVVLPDYIGLKAFGSPSPELHPYLVGEATAIASLDAVRAAGQLVATQAPAMCARPRVVPFGASQGGHAALWVDRIAPYYAPELQLMGVVAAVPPADLLEQGRRALGALVPSSGNMVAYLTAASSWYGVDNRIDEVFVSDWDVRLPQILRNNCDGGPELKSVTALDQIFLPAFLSAAMAPDFPNVSPWGCMSSEGSLMSTSVSRITPNRDSYGILYMLGSDDQTVDPAIERSSFTTLCNQGMPLEFLECAGAGHSDAPSWGLEEILTFIDARFAEVPIDVNNLCQVHAASVCSGTP
ncbi:MAG: hypothetical protein OEU50_06580 [Gammaproteobacteria bacterium]|nr:hypothetical protein [Gammaproteobacteria bacterium]